MGSMTFANREDYKRMMAQEIDKGSPVMVTGRVFQCLYAKEGDTFHGYMIMDSDSYIYLFLMRVETSNILIKGDRVIGYGLYGGLYSYKTVLGSESTIPVLVGYQYTLE
jgi:hypothetical protein